MARFTVSPEKHTEISDLIGCDRDEYMATIFDYDWTNADEHQEWLNTEPAQSIVDWATCILRPNVEPIPED